MMPKDTHNSNISSYPIFGKLENASVIMDLTQKEAKNVGIGKSTLHYLRKHARSPRSFKVYKPVLEKLRGST